MVTDSLNYWRIRSELSIREATLLLLLEDPSKEFYKVEELPMDERPAGYEPHKMELIYALKSKAIEGTIVYLPLLDVNGIKCADTDEIDINKSFITVESLKPFLRKKGFIGDFFFPVDLEEPQYLNPKSLYFAPKLAAAVKAWEAITPNKSLLNGKTPKQALEKWLREHASEFGLTASNGEPFTDTIEQISKITNWKPEGGAPKTPSPM